MWLDPSMYLFACQMTNYFESYEGESILCPQKAIKKFPWINNFHHEHLFMWTTYNLLLRISHWISKIPLNQKHYTSLHILGNGRWRISQQNYVLLKWFHIINIWNRNICLFNEMSGIWHDLIWKQYLCISLLDKSTDCIQSHLLLITDQSSS